MVSARRIMVTYSILMLASVVQAQQATAPMVNGLPLVNWRDAGGYYDREVVVYGRVVQAANIGSFAFLNFHPDFRKNFTVAVRRRHFAAFPTPPEQLYRNKLVAVRGTVERYRDKPEIILTAPQQIVILPDETTDILAAVQKNFPQGADVLPAPTATPAPGSTPAPAVTPVMPISNRLTVATVNLRPILGSAGAFCSAAPADMQSQAKAFEPAGTILRDFNADAVAVQWGGSLDCLKRLGQQIVPQLGYAYLSGHAGPDGTVDCALLSRFPIMNSSTIAQYTHQGQPAKFRHPPLSLDLQLPNGRILTLVVASLPGDNEKLSMGARIAEAKGLRAALDDLLRLRPDAQLLVAGGFGDSLKSKPVQSLLGTGTSALMVPGYIPSKRPEAPTPLIAKIGNFIVALPVLGGHYMPGSTRIREGQEIGPAVAVSFQTPAPASPAPPPPLPRPAGASEF